MEKITGRRKILLGWWMDTHNSPANAFRFMLIFMVLAVAYSFSLYKVVHEIYAANPNNVRTEAIYMPPGAEMVSSFTNVSSQGGIALPIVELSLEQYKARAGENSLHYIVVNRYTETNTGDIPFEYFAKNESSTHVLHAKASPIDYFINSKWGTLWPSTWTIKNGKLVVEREFDFYYKPLIVFTIIAILLFISVFLLNSLWKKRIDKIKVKMMNPK